MSAAELAERYARRGELAAARAAGGAPVVGIVGRDIPAALVAAAGGLPYRIPAEEVELGEAEGYLGRSVDRAALAIAAAALSGRLDFLRGILIAHDSEGSVRLFYALRELHRRGRIPIPVHLVDQVHLPRESTLRFNTAQLASMLATVSDWTGVATTRASLAAAWEQHHELRAALVELRDARGRSDGPGGLVALHAYGVAAAAPDDDAVALIRAASEPRSAELLPLPLPLPLLLTGSAPLGDVLYRSIEDAGAVVVAEDHDWGDPILSDELPATPPGNADEAALVAARARLAGAPAAASASMAVRARATADAAARSGARALLGVIRPHDDAPAWDWGRQCGAVELPAALIKGTEADDPAEIRAALATLGAAA